MLSGAPHGDAPTAPLLPGCGRESPADVSEPLPGHEAVSLTVEKRRNQYSNALPTSMRDFLSLTKSASATTTTVRDAGSGTVLTAARGPAS